MLTVFRIAVATVLPVLLVHLSPQTRARQEAGPVKFSFRSLEGGNVTDSDLRGKVSVLIFTPSWLPVTRKQSASVNRLTAEFAPRGVVFFLVCTDSESPSSKNYASDKQLREFARKRRLRLPILRDPEGKTLREYGKDQVPLIVVLDKQGLVDGKPLEGFGPEGALDRTLGPQLTRLTR
ncbi:MAG: TlpA family protein disulfide reductase [Acidobacteriota bacterium]|nr:TlpA family protein disulfide reductase [Acidobacteriota bacterium]